ncbi:hypothetical protein HPB47_012131 [Ixodes persulcatus]|uniref:Uncharacterized protein n=1 Tax=Ixodes persulcatus TaxID=34615 RepID=A0AC60NUD9_IXOPE|nr:hypothetical protein HPB47_012131 [Ixodes persulcatus]
MREPQEQPRGKGEPEERSGSCAIGGRVFSGAVPLASDGRQRRGLPPHPSPFPGSRDLTDRASGTSDRPRAAGTRPQRWERANAYAPFRHVTEEHGRYEPYYTA